MDFNSVVSPFFVAQLSIDDSISGADSKLQPIYAFSPRHIEDMRVGNAVLMSESSSRKRKTGGASGRKETEKERREAVARKVRPPAENSGRLNL